MLEMLEMLEMLAGVRFIVSDLAPHHAARPPRSGQAHQDC